MPGYDFKCGSCLIVDEKSFPIGEAPRILACQYCGGIAQLVIGSQVQIAPSALEGKGAEVRATNAKDFALDKDRYAYKRMRDRGLQPKTVGGSSRLENEVGDNVDIEWKPRLKDVGEGSWESKKERVKEGMQLSKEAGFTTDDVKKWDKVTDGK